MYIKKYLASILFVLVFGAYALMRYPANAALIDTTASMPAPLPPDALKPAQSGQYMDGTYTGYPETGFYGTVQVRATVSGGQLVNVQFLQYPNVRSTSRFLNGQAMPVLWQQAIQAQSANVDGVSGASDTSAAFRESLAFALAKAQN